MPIVWLPIAGYLFLRSVLQFIYGSKALPAFSADPTAPFKLLAATYIPVSAFAQTLACFLLGNFIWTLLEYGFHRLLFHVDYFLPDHPAALTVHFLMHGIHHYLPMDR